MNGRLSNIGETRAIHFVTCAIAGERKASTFAHERACKRVWQFERCKRIPFKHMAHSKRELLDQVCPCYMDVHVAVFIPFSLQKLQQR